MSEWKALRIAVQKLGENVADFPVGAVSIDDCKPTVEKIQDLRMKLKRLNSIIISLRGWEEARRMTEVPEGNVKDSYDALQEKMVQCAINDQTVETCLWGDAMEAILSSDDDSEIKRTLQNLLQKMYTMNDRLIAFEAEATKLKERELELTIELKDSLLEFKEFLKEQEAIREKKLEETNPKIAAQKAQMAQRLQKINVMKRLITNLIAASGEQLGRITFFPEMMKKHRELIDHETISKMAREKFTEESQ